MQCRQHCFEYLKGLHVVAFKAILFWLLGFIKVKLNITNFLKEGFITNIMYEQQNLMWCAHFTR